MQTLMRHSILSILIGCTPLSGLEHAIAQIQPEESSETEDQPTEEEQVKHDHSEEFYAKSFTAENIFELEKELKEHPTSRGYVRLSDLYCGKKQFPKGKLAAEKAIALDPMNWEGYQNRGACLSTLGQLEEAWKTFEKAIKLSPERPEPYYSLGVIEGKRRRYTSALIFYKKTLQIDPNDSLAKEAIREINEKLHIY